MACRYDVSQVPLQGSYVAKRCPVRAQNDTVLPAEPQPPDAFLERLFEKGRAFETEILAELTSHQPDAVVIEGSGEKAEVATMEAMAAAAPVILQARLRDEAGRRVAKPDLLIRAACGGYRPVDVKWHAALDPCTETGTPARISPLTSAGLEAAVADPSWLLRRNEDDALQLAHYQRALEANGQAAVDGRFGGIIGTDRQVVWYDLDQPMWRTPSLSARSKLRSTMERYDFEFHFRLDIIAVAQRHLEDAAVALLVAPVRCDECPSCPWRDHCGPVLREPPGDVSLLPRVGWTQWKAHRDHGVRNLAELAALDVRTAQVVAAKLGAPRLIQLAAAVPPSTPLRDLDDALLKPNIIERLADLGISDVAALRSLDPKTSRYSDLAMGALPEQIDLARAFLGSEAVYRRRGVPTLVVPRAGVEVDVDMENTERGVYLWGALVSDQQAVSPGQYQPFVTWELLTPEEETKNSLLFWRWLMALREAACSQGRTFAAYCWNASAENQPLRRLGREAGITEEVEAFIASTEWVDLLKVWDSQLITGGPSGLKTIAELIGINWEVEDPGGAGAMVKYDLAVGQDTESSIAARAWLLTYNRGDVQATQAIRCWMSATSLRGIESI
jgi:predicted RecB family nuclease